MRLSISRALGVALFVALALQSGSSFAQVTNGNIGGRVTDEATKKPLAGVTVTATSPAMQGEQTEFTDAQGNYLITALPPGEYVIRFYFSNIKVERTGVYLNADKTLNVSVAMPTAQAEQKTYRVIEKAPTVDVGNTQVQTQVTQELVRNTPIAPTASGRRTYESLLTLAPGSAANAGDSSLPPSFSGATGPENNYLIDGMNTTNPGFGLLGTQLTVEFIGETEIITGGYQAEYGRATGGVVSVNTKRGSNKWSGSAWLNAQPFTLDPRLIGRSGESIASATKLLGAYDFGFDVGGPIVKDKVWFYVGFAPTFSILDSQRYLRRRTADNAGATAGADYGGDIDASVTCPSYLPQELCGGAATGYNLVQMNEYTRQYRTQSRLYNYILKFNFQMSPNHQLEIAYIGSPNTRSGYDEDRSFNGADGYFLASKTNQIHDVNMAYIGKVLNRKMQLDLKFGYHVELYDKEANNNVGGDGIQVRDRRTNSLYAYENIVTPCAPISINGSEFNPCPSTNYRGGGYGFLENFSNQRFSLLGGMTYFAKAAGTHAIKLGFDSEFIIYRRERYYTGGEDGGFYDILTNGRVRRSQFATNIDGMGVLQPQGFNPTTKTFNESVYLRDSWSILNSGVTVNVGVRWEFQQVKGDNDTTQINIWDNIAPRVGVVWDPTRKGRGKVFASYGRFFSVIPLNLNDRQFTGEGSTQQTLTTGCSPVPAGTAFNPVTGPASCGPWPQRLSILGGQYGSVAPTLKGMFSDEFVGGVSWDVGWDVVLGASYIYRNLGRIVEDVSPDGGVTYFLANPGDPTDSGVVKDLQNQIASATDPMKKEELQRTLRLYQGVSRFEKPKRVYQAMVLTAQKRMSRNFTLLASYTYSRTYGNYPGLFQASNGQLDPNISSQYDLTELLVNKNGPLPNDRPHNIKLTGAYSIPIKEVNHFTIGINFQGYSGTPIEVLGSHPIYGTSESFILPRGAGGRTPFITQFDLHIGYSRKFKSGVKLDITWDTFNLFNQREITSVDQNYTLEDVGPVRNGRLSDLANLKNTSGQAITINPNYGQPTSFQIPLSMRFGVRASF